MSERPLPPGFADTDIAIVGMAGRFPGAPDVAAFWKNLRDGVDAVVRLGDEELRAAGVSDEERADPGYVPACYPIPDMEGFDAPFFGFSPREAAIMDPQQRHFLEVAWTALEHAGHDSERAPGSVGLFAGCGASLYLMRNLLTNPALVADVGFFLLRHTGNDKDFLATRASYLMNLRGPSVTVQTACSTSLVAVHLACQSLLANECDMALAGGSTVRQPHRIGYAYVEGEIMSPDGSCRTFDAAAEGTVFGSGTGVVVLRRLVDALRDGDTVHAVIKGSAINNDGSAKVGYLAPSVDAQAEAVVEALAVSGVEPAHVGFIECHGTATPVGDPIEVVALMQAFRDVDLPRGSIVLGAVKTNVGHLDTAAGVAGLVKTVEALKHAEIPPTLHYRSPNPAIDFDSGPFQVSDQLLPWPRKGPHRIAGVTALGAGGTNAHVVVQEAPAVSASVPPARAWQIYPLSAKTATALDRQSAELATFLRATELAPADVAHTLQVGRRAFPRRRFAVARSAADAAGALEARDPKLTPEGEASTGRRHVAFMFAGGGAQHPGMGRGLYEGEPTYRAAVDECLAILQPQLDWDLKAFLYPAAERHEAAARELERPSRSLPCLFITQYAMAKLLMAWGVDPEAMLGHSMGEYTAAHLAGVFSLADALALVTVRGKLFETIPPGGMLSVPMGADALAAVLPVELSIAAVNAPELCVASGPTHALDALEKKLLADDIECSRIHINIAAHSAMLEPILAEFGSFCRGIRYAKPERRFMSNVSGTWITPEQATDPDYWVRHLRHTVRFADGVGELLADPGRVLLEVGPGRTLATLSGLHGAKRPTHAILTSMRHPADSTDDVATALAAFGRLWVSGVEVEWDALAPGEPRRRVPIPTYPFEHEPYFIAPGAGAVQGPSLARRKDVGSWFWRPSWKRAPLSRAAAAPPDARWLVLHHATGVGAALAERLRAGGASVTSVLPGPRFEQIDARTFRLDPRALDDFERLIAALLADGVPTRLVHAWAATDGAVDEGLAFYSLLNLAQALAREGVEEPARLDVVTTGGQYVGGEGALEPDRALVLGPVRVLPKEFPHLRCRAVDLPHPGAGGWLEDRALAQLVAELGHEGDEEAVAWRGSERFEQTFEEVPLPAATDDLGIRPEGVWLVTGGLGGLGYLVAEELARTARARLVLTSRSAERTPAVDALERMGARVLVVAADVTDAAAMRRVVDEAHRAFGPINGVVHAAGLVEDALVLMKEAESAARVLAPKVTGTRVLEEVTRGEPLEHVVYFSSRASFAGVAGQVDYTSASAFLDAHAAARSHLQGIPVVSLDWSAWQDVGIAARGLSAGRPVAHPLLDRCVAEGGEGAEYRSVLSTRTHWLLDGHRLKSGEALVPGTGYLELIAAAAQERPGRGAVELRDVFFVSPFMVADDASRELRVTVEQNGSEHEVVVEGRPSGATGAWEEHARGLIGAPAATARTLDVGAVRARCATRRVTFAADQQRNANLQLGHRWSNLRQIDFGSGEALAQLELPEDVAAEASEFRIHPALLDVACACAQEMVPGFDSHDQFFVPVSYGRVTVLEDLPPRCVSHIRLQPGAGPDADEAVYDITIATPEGKVVVDIGDFTMMRVRDARTVGPSSSAARGAGQPLQMQGAITPVEGMDAFRRVLAARLPGHLVVSPQHLGAYLTALRQPPEPTSPPPTPRRTVDLVDATAAEEALAGHEAIDRAVVIAQREQGGEVRAVAFVVWEIGEQATIAELRRFLKGKVSEEMIPQQIVELEDLPLDRSGAVDRTALPDPFAPVDDYVAPGTDAEKAIAEIWKELLGVARVSVHDNFLDVGGHSLLAMRAISRMARELGVRLNPSVMTLNTLGQIAAECDAKAGAAR